MRNAWKGGMAVDIIWILSTGRIQGGRGMRRQVLVSGGKERKQLSKIAKVSVG
jgi:hypothetical protein